MIHGGPLPRAQTRQLTLLAVCAMTVMLFGGFAAALLVRRASPDWVAHPLPAAMWGTTALLLFSSVTCELARRRTGGAWFAGTAVLGGGFLVGQFWALSQWAAGGVSAGPQVAFAWMLCVVHALHVGGGLAALAVTRRRGVAIDQAAGFWHFLGLLWCALLVLLTQL
ncbi:MAG: hypothetical protein ACYTGX_07235 [Planctomycetota bacterium]|jgi:cytochrome c oxidase subunit 3